MKKRILSLLLTLCLLAGLLPLSASAIHDEDGKGYDTWASTGAPVQFEIYKSTNRGQFDRNPIEYSLGEKVEKLHYDEGISNIYWLKCNVGPAELESDENDPFCNYTFRRVYATLTTSGSNIGDYMCFLGNVKQCQLYRGDIWIEFYCGRDLGTSDYRIFLECSLVYGGFSNYYYSNQVFTFDGDPDITPNGKWSVEHDVAVRTPGMTYCGRALQPKPTVTWGGGPYYIPVEGVDYTLSWKNNLNVGTGIVTVTGKGRFTGSKDAEFPIYSAQLNLNGIRLEGTARVGCTISVVEIRTAMGDPVDSTFTGKFEWLADDVPIPGATGTTYTLTKNELGKLIDCHVISTCTNYNDEAYGHLSGFVEAGSGKDESPPQEFKPDPPVVTPDPPAVDPDPPVPTVGGFKDVPAGIYYADAVLWAVENEITKGETPERFSPNGPCTRAQAVTFLWRAAGKPDPSSSSCPFLDVTPGAYYYDAVLWAVEKGITVGTSDTAFSPNQPCTRGQIVTFLHRSAGSPPVSGENKFTDAQSGFFVNAVIWAVQKGITQGTNPAGKPATFSPFATCTRSQIVTFLYRSQGS